MVQILLEFVEGLISLSTQLMWAALVEENPAAACYRTSRRASQSRSEDINL